MQRRRSSLVTISLDDEATDEEAASSRNPAAVIEIWQNDERSIEVDGFKSAEKIFTFIVDIDHHDSPVVQEELHPIGIFNQIVYCFGNCKNGNLCSRGWDQILEYIGKNWETFNEKLHEKCESSYLEMYFMYANVCGVSPFRIGQDSQQVVWLKKMVLQPLEAGRYKDSPEVARKLKESSDKIPFYIVNALAAVDTIFVSKGLMVNLIEAKKVGSTEIGVYLINSSECARILIRIGFWISLKFHPQKYIKAIQTIVASPYRKHLYVLQRFVESLLVCGSSIFIVLIKTHIGLCDGIEKYIISNAEFTLSQFCLTKSCHHMDVSQLNFGTISLGLLGWATYFAGNLFEQIARDGILLSALTLGKSANQFRFRGKMEGLNAVDSIIIGAEIKTDYNWIKRISKDINSAFNIVFRFLLLANIFMFAVFLDEWFDPQVGKIVKGVNLVNVIFVCITFYYANQTAKTGDRFREWMKEEKNHTSMRMSQMDVMMENSSSTSIGFGRGALYIYDSTLIAFASAVAAYYFGIVETRASYMNHRIDNSVEFTNSSNVR
ncbi:unnamed protein product [Orchesella dallaii]|uniref:Gustatory receptor n=1 Tax=Orchesella dallaii TaxID=48710 RepID=A0ABP1RVB3_9HEXA